MLVRVLKAHSNGYGEAYEKAVGDVYDHPSPNGLIQRKRLEAADGNSGGQGGRLSRAGQGARGTAKGNSAKHIAAGAKKGGRAGTKRRAAKGTSSNRGA